MFQVSVQTTCRGYPQWEIAVYSPTGEDHMLSWGLSLCLSVSFHARLAGAPSPVLLWTHKAQAHFSVMVTVVCIYHLEMSAEAKLSLCHHHSLPLDYAFNPILTGYQQNCWNIRRRLEKGWHALGKSLFSCSTCGVPTNHSIKYTSLYQLICIIHVIGFSFWLT